MDDKDLKIRIKADTAEFGSAMKSVQGQLNQLGGAGVVSSFAGGVAGGAIATILTEGLGKAIQYAKDFRVEAARIVDTSDRLGISVGRLQALEFAALGSGVSPETLAATLDNLVKSQGQALRGDGGKRATFERLGIGPDDLGRDPETLLTKLGEGLRRTGLSATATADALGILGNQARKILPSLRDGFKDAADSAGTLFGVIDESAIRASDKLGKLLDQLKSATKILLPNILINSPFAKLVSSLFKGVTGSDTGILEFLTGADSSPLPLPPGVGRQKPLDSKSETVAALAAGIGFAVRSQNDLQSIGLFVGGRGKDSASTLQEQLNVLREQLREQRSLNQSFQTNFGN